MTDASLNPNPYEPPAITPLDRPMVERRPLGQRRGPPARDVAGHDALALLDTYGSPLVIFDGDRLRRSYEAFSKPFTDRWPRTQIAYSVKTNYLSSIVGAIYSFGAKVEVVSGFEYAICRRLGIPGPDICFNGPWKKSAEIAEAFAQGSQVNLDNYDELLRTEAIASRVPGRHRVGIRVNMEVSYPPWDKFGFSLTSGEALRMAQRLSDHADLELAGLHMHVGTYIPNPDQYEKGAAALVELALRIRDVTGVAPGTLDMGGGYASENRLRGQMLPGTATSPTPAMYAECVTKPLRDARERHDYEPDLVLEPGRAIVDDCGDLLTTAVSVKPLLGGGKAVVLDAGVNILPTAYWYDHEVTPVLDAPGRRPEKVKLFGPLCMQIDVVRPTAVLPAPRANDVFRIRRIGAYNFSQSMQFIYPRPTYLLIRGDAVDVIREAETVAEVTRLERVPRDLLAGDAAPDEDSC